jgi:PAS domain S-box-containing protein
MRAEDELVDSEQLRSIVVDSALDAIVAINSAGEVTLWNQSAENLFGWSREEVIGRPLTETIIPEQYRNRHHEGLSQCIETGTGAILGQRLELSGMHKNGQELDIELTVVRHSSPRGPVFVGFMRDISFQKRVQKEILTAQKLESVGQLAGGIAHDFNNVLSVIVGFGELATKKLPSDHEVQENLREILLASQRCFAINNQLLAFARKQFREPTIISINAVIDGLRPMLRTLIKEDVELTTKLAEDLAPVLADAGQIEQMLTNLVINARDAMPNGGRIMIETRNLFLEPDSDLPLPDLSPGRYTTISVTDTGSGIPSENLDRIFEPFFTTKEDKGSGLGLAGAYGIVKNAGGRISVYSEVGHGTMFRIYLPAAQGKPSQATGPTPRVAAGGTETVLVAEDNEQVRSVIVQTLTHFGYKVLSAKSGVEALAEANEYDGHIHLLITDLVMPRMGGTELAQKLAAIRPGIKVVFLSGYTEEAVTNTGVQGVVGAFLQKPVLPTDLAQMVRKVLDSSQTTTQSA